MRRPILRSREVIVGAVSSCMFHPVCRGILPSRGTVPVLEQLGGVGAGEQVYGPVGHDPRPVEVLAELLEVDALPDQRPDEPGELHAHDVD